MKLNYIEKNINIPLNNTVTKMEYNFEEIGIPEPPLFDNYDEETKTNIYEYLSKLDEHNKNIYKIAHQHLETSFNVVKSNGYLKWLQKKQNDMK